MIEYSAFEVAAGLAFIVNAAAVPSFVGLVWIGAFLLWGTLWIRPVGRRRRQYAFWVMVALLAAVHFALQLGAQIVYAINSASPDREPRWLYVLRVLGFPRAETSLQKVQVLLPAALCFSTCVVQAAGLVMPQRSPQHHRLRWNPLAAIRATSNLTLFLTVVSAPLLGAGPLYATAAVAAVATGRSPLDLVLLAALLWQLHRSARPRVHGGNASRARWAPVFSRAHLLYLALWSAAYLLLVYALQIPALAHYATARPLAWLRIGVITADTRVMDAARLAVHALALAATYLFLMVQRVAFVPSLRQTPDDDGVVRAVAALLESRAREAAEAAEGGQSALASGRAGGFTSSPSSRLPGALQTQQSRTSGGMGPPSPMLSRLQRPTSVGRSARVSSAEGSTLEPRASMPGGALTRRASTLAAASALGDSDPEAASGSRAGVLPPAGHPPHSDVGRSYSHTLAQARLHDIVQRAVSAPEELEGRTILSHPSQGLYLHPSPGYFTMGYGALVHILQVLAKQSVTVALALVSFAFLHPCGFAALLLALAFFGLYIWESQLPRARRKHSAQAARAQAGVGRALSSVTCVDICMHAIMAWFAFAYAAAVFNLSDSLPVFLRLLCFSVRTAAAPRSRMFFDTLTAASLEFLALLAILAAHSRVSRLPPLWNVVTKGVGDLLPVSGQTAAAATPGAVHLGTAPPPPGAEDAAQRSLLLQPHRAAVAVPTRGERVRYSFLVSFQVLGNLLVPMMWLAVAIACPCALSLIYIGVPACGWAVATSGFGTSSSRVGEPERHRFLRAFTSVHAALLYLVRLPPTSWYSTWFRTWVPGILGAVGPPPAMRLAALLAFQILLASAHAAIGAKVAALNAGDTPELEASDPEPERQTETSAAGARSDTGAVSVDMAPSTSSRLHVSGSARGCGDDEVQAPWSRSAAQSTDGNGAEQLGEQLLPNGVVGSKVDAGEREVGMRFAADGAALGRRVPKPPTRAVLLAFASVAVQAGSQLVGCALLIVPLFVLPVSGTGALYALLGFTALYMPHRGFAPDNVFFEHAELVPGLGPTEPLLNEHTAHSDSGSLEGGVRSERPLWRYSPALMAAIAALCGAHAVAQYLLMARLVRPGFAACEVLRRVAGLECGPWSSATAPALVAPFVLLAVLNCYRFLWSLGRDTLSPESRSSLQDERCWPAFARRVVVRHSHKLVVLGVALLAMTQPCLLAWALLILTFLAAVLFGGPNSAQNSLRHSSRVLTTNACAVAVALWALGQYVVSSAYLRDHVLHVTSSRAEAFLAVLGLQVVQDQGRVPGEIVTGILLKVSVLLFIALKRHCSHWRRVMHPHQLSSARPGALAALFWPPAGTTLHTPSGSEDPAYPSESMFFKVAKVQQVLALWNSVMKAGATTSRREAERLQRYLQQASGAELLIETPSPFAGESGTARRSLFQTYFDTYLAQPAMSLSRGVFQRMCDALAVAALTLAAFAEDTVGIAGTETLNFSLILLAMLSLNVLSLAYVAIAGLGLFAKHRFRSTLPRVATPLLLAALAFQYVLLVPVPDALLLSFRHSKAHNDTDAANDKLLAWLGLMPSETSVFLTAAVLSLSVMCLHRNAWTKHVNELCSRDERESAVHRHTASRATDDSILPTSYSDDEPPAHAHRVFTLLRRLRCAVPAEVIVLPLDEARTTQSLVQSAPGAVYQHAAPCCCALKDLPAHDAAAVGVIKMRSIVMPRHVFMLEDRARWGWREWYRFWIYRLSLDSVMILVVCLCCLQRDLAHAAYLALTLVLFRRRESLRLAGNGLFFWMPLVNYCVIAALLLFQTPWHSLWQLLRGSLPSVGDCDASGDSRGGFFSRDTADRPVDSLDCTLGQILGLHSIGPAGSWSALSFGPHGAATPLIMCLAMQVQSRLLDEQGFRDTVALLQAGQSHLRTHVRNREARRRSRHMARTLQLSAARAARLRRIARLKRNLDHTRGFLGLDPAHMLEGGILSPRASIKAGERTKSSRLFSEGPVMHDVMLDDAASNADSDTEVPRLERPRLLHPAADAPAEPGPSLSDGPVGQVSASGVHDTDFTSRTHKWLASMVATLSHYAAHVHVLSFFLFVSDLSFLSAVYPIACLVHTLPSPTRLWIWRSLLIYTEIFLLAQYVYQVALRLDCLTMLGVPDALQEARRLGLHSNMAQVAPLFLLYLVLLMHNYFLDLVWPRPGSSRNTGSASGQDAARQRGGWLHHALASLAGLVARLVVALLHVWRYIRALCSERTFAPHCLLLHVKEGQPGFLSVSGGRDALVSAVNRALAALRQVDTALAATERAAKAPAAPIWAALTNGDPSVLAAACLSEAAVGSLLHSRREADLSTVSPLRTTYYDTVHGLREDCVSVLLEVTVEPEPLQYGWQFDALPSAFRWAAHQGRLVECWRPMRAANLAGTALRRLIHASDALSDEMQDVPASGAPPTGALAHLWSRPLWDEVATSAGSMSRRGSAEAPNAPRSTPAPSPNTIVALSQPPSTPSLGTWAGTERTPQHRRHGSSVSSVSLGSREVATPLSAVQSALQAVPVEPGEISMSDTVESISLSQRHESVRAAHAAELAASSRESAEPLPGAHVDVAPGDVSALASAWMADRALIQEDLEWHSEGGKDWYTLTLTLNAAAFVYFAMRCQRLVTYDISTSESISTSHSVPARYLLALVFLFCNIIVDRVFYTMGSTLGKALLHLAEVAVYLSFALYISWDAFTAEADVLHLRIFLALRLGAMAMSALQVKCGYPSSRHTGGGPSHGRQSFYFYRHPDVPHWLAFQVFRGVPFLYELKVMLDWSVTTTTLTLVDWLKLEDIRASLYNRQCDLTMRSMSHSIGQAQPAMEKFLQGSLLFAGLLALLWAPLLAFSSSNPTFKIPSVSRFSFNASIVHEVSLPDGASYATQIPLFTSSLVSSSRPWFRNLTAEERRPGPLPHSGSPHLPASLAAYDPKQLQLLCASEDDDDMWLPSARAEKRLRGLLRSEAARDSASPTALRLNVAFSALRSFPPPSAYGGPQCEGTSTVQLSVETVAALLDVLEGKRAWAPITGWPAAAKPDPDDGSRAAAKSRHRRDTPACSHRRCSGNSTRSGSDAGEALGGSNPDAPQPGLLSWVWRLKDHKCRVEATSATSLAATVGPDDRSKMAGWPIFKVACYVGLRVGKAVDVHTATGRWWQMRCLALDGNGNPLSTHDDAVNAAPLNDDVYVYDTGSIPEHDRPSLASTSAPWQLAVDESKYRETAAWRTLKRWLLGHAQRVASHKAPQISDFVHAGCPRDVESTRYPSALAAAQRAAHNDSAPDGAAVSELDGLWTDALPEYSGGPPMIVALIERVQSGLLGETLSSMGIVGLYVTIVFGVGRFLRLSLTNLRMRIPYEDLPSTHNLVTLCNDIAVAREERELLLEEQLFYSLINIYRSPTVLFELTKKDKAS